MNDIILLVSDNLMNTQNTENFTQKGFEIRIEEQCKTEGNSLTQAALHFLSIV